MPIAMQEKISEPSGMDRMNKVNVLDQHFEPHKTTIQYYYGKNIMYQFTP